VGAREVSAEQAKKLFAKEGGSTRSSSSTRPRADLALHPGDFTDLCRGPHLQDSKPIKAVKLTGLAGARTGAAMSTTNN
jgi:threonyl-tRNA synthetase